GYDESFHEYSPGQQLTSEAIRDSCDRGLSEFDFLGPDMEWKRDWEPALRTHSWLTIFRSIGKAKLVHEARFVIWPVARAAAREGRRGGAAADRRPALARWWVLLPAAAPSRWGRPPARGGAAPLVCGGCVPPGRSRAAGGRAGAGAEVTL